MDLVHVLDDGPVIAFPKRTTVDVIVVKPLCTRPFERADEPLAVVVLVEQAAHVVIHNFQLQFERTREGGGFEHGHQSKNILNNVFLDTLDGTVWEMLEEFQPSGVKVATFLEPTNQRFKVVQHGIKVRIKRRIAVSGFNHHLIGPRMRGRFGNIIRLHGC